MAPSTPHPARGTAPSTPPSAPGTASALRTPHFALAALVIIGAVLFRSWFFLHYDESYFDSDQAIVGLMAKHLVEGRAKPLFFYGQEYMLAVEAWVMAPVFAVLGPTVFALRLTMILVNIAAALALWWLLIRDAWLSPCLAALAAAPFAAAPFITAAHLVEAQGGNVEPFLWMLVAWILRRRPIPLGLVLGVAFLNREFAVYAVPALLAIQLAEGRGRLAPLVRPWLMTMAAFAVVLTATAMLKPSADLLGPGTAGTRPSPEATDNVSELIGRVRVDVAALPRRFRTMINEHLPQLFGLYPFRPSLVGIGYFAQVGWPELLPLVTLVSLVVLVWLPLDIFRRHSSQGIVFPAYLGLVALQSAIAYALSRDPAMVTFRYGLLALFLPTALGALALQTSRPALLRALGALVLSLLVSAACLDHTGVLRAARVAPPPPRLMPLAAHLEARGITVARAGYWRAYALTFLTGERVVVASTDMQRIQEYQRRADEAGPAAVIIDAQSCQGRQEMEVFEGWHLCR